eukprot:TRINITY_DN8589_c0_g1_i1.p1 TRINITY_DN8589_c0_g1~~TRINITY_DN8589_c0_g1_i1.p1  ORF type:complete len:454 (-),score=163.97 TRINITY_DN8589_c0_g1_i1:81-1385(-)
MTQKNKNTKNNKKVNHSKFGYEFGGPVGTFLITLILPIFTIAMFFFCNEKGTLNLKPFKIPEFQLPQTIFTREAFGVFIGWFIFQAILHLIVPGKTMDGVLLSNGKRLKYKINGFSCCLITFAVVFFCEKQGYIKLSWIYDNLFQLLIASNICVFIFSIYLYLRSFKRGELLAAGGNSGNIFYDFFIGRELNPRILGGHFDLKYFCELRPGLIGWLLINFAMAAKQFEIHGQLTNSMVIVLMFQTWYVLDALYFEPAILTTMDITTDGFGFMLAFGDMVWVPFLYSLQSRYIASQSFPLSMEQHTMAIVIALQLIGYYIFRGANSEKNKFRTNPNDPQVSYLKYIETKTGSKLIISGWWGVARHINYTGDLMMALSWCLPCGTAHIIPYFYFIYFAILLIHREARDEHKCATKYGIDWQKYCQIVKFRMIPYIY